MSITGMDREHMSRAVELALRAEKNGNLPIGAVICLEGQIIGEGSNAIWKPNFSPYRHAEMEALKSVQEELWTRAGEMTLYTTLEPCLMCLGAILLHGIGKVIYGSSDPFGGAEKVIPSLPPFFRGQFNQIQWIGPAFSEICNPLYERIKTLERSRGLKMD